MPDTEALNRLEVNVENLTTDVKVIKEAIVGSVENNEKIGIKGQLALAKQSIGRLWWAVSIIIVAILGSATWIIRSSL